MNRSRVLATLLIAIVVAPLAFLEMACSRSPEQQMLRQFFRAAQARDNTTLAMMSAASFDPRESGIVEDFDVTNVSAEQRIPLNFKALLEAQNKAREAEVEFGKRKKAYQDENLKAIEEIIKLERDPKAKMSPAQMKLKAEWDKWREDTSMHAKATAAARAAVSGQSGPVEASLTQPGLPAFNAAKFDGDLVSKAVTINADVRKEGQTTPKTMVVTMQRAVGTLGGETREGRWIISRIEGA